MKKKIIIYSSVIFALSVIVILTFISYPVKQEGKLETVETIPFPDYDNPQPKFENHDISKFKEKEVQYFLKAIKRLEYTNEGCLVTEGEPGRLYAWQFTYSDSILIVIYVQDFKFLKPQADTFEGEQFLDWTVKDFLYEEIHSIRIYKRRNSGYHVIAETR